MKVVVDTSGNNNSSEATTTDPECCEQNPLMTSSVENEVSCDDAASQTQKSSVKILKRPSGEATSSQDFQRCSSSNSLKSYEEREAAYAEARMRIFGANGAPDVGDSEALSDSSQSSIPTPPLLLKGEREDCNFVILKRPNPSLRQQLQLNESIDNVEEVVPDISSRPVPNNTFDSRSELTRPFVRSTAHAGTRAPCFVDMAKPPPFLVNRPPPPVGNSAVDPSNYTMYSPYFVSTFAAAPQFTVPPPPPGHPLAYGTLPADAARYFEKPFNTPVLGKTSSVSALPRNTKEIARPMSSGDLVATSMLQKFQNSCTSKPSFSVAVTPETDVLRSEIGRAVAEILSKYKPEDSLSTVQSDLVEGLVPLLRGFVAHSEAKAGDEIARLRRENEELRKQLQNSQRSKCGVVKTTPKTAKLHSTSDSCSYNSRGGEPQDPSHT